MRWQVGMEKCCAEQDNEHVGLRNSIGLHIAAVAFNLPMQRQLLSCLSLFLFEAVLQGSLASS